MAVVMLRPLTLRGMVSKTCPSALYPRRVTSPYVVALLKWCGYMWAMVTHNFGALWCRLFRL